MSNKIYYSTSTLRSYGMCPATQVYKQMERRGEIKADPSLPFIFGIAGHEGAEQHLKTGVDPKVVANNYVKANLLDKFTLPFLEKSGIKAEKIQEKQNHLDKCLDNFTGKIMPRLLESNPSGDFSGRTEVRYEVPFRQGYLVGVMDYDTNEQCIDWKFGAKVPGDEFMMNEPQPPVYNYIKQMAHGVSPLFSFVYPVGRPTLTIQDGVYKTGPRRGQPKMVTDYENGLRFKFPIYQDDDKVARMFNDYINPWAEAYEAGIIFKNPGYQGPNDEMPQNCKSCSYRTACRVDRVPLEKRSDFIIKDPDLIDLVAGE